jgi:hypothetical protein
MRVNLGHVQAIADLSEGYRIHLTTKDTKYHQGKPLETFLGDTSCPWWFMNWSAE